MKKTNKEFLYTALKGGTMKAKATFLSVVLVTLTLVFGFNAFCDEIYPNPTANVYGDLLDQYIARCDAKVEMQRSGLENVRRAATIAMLKGTFAKAYRQELINGMVENEVNPKDYKVQVYLNDRFYGLVR